MDGIRVNENKPVNPVYSPISLLDASSLISFNSATSEDLNSRIKTLNFLESAYISGKTIDIQDNIVIENIAYVIDNLVNARFNQSDLENVKKVLISLRVFILDLTKGATDNNPMQAELDIIKEQMEDLDYIQDIFEQTKEIIFEKPNDYLRFFNVVRLMVTKISDIDRNKTLLEALYQLIKTVLYSLQNSLLNYEEMDGVLDRMKNLLNELEVLPNNYWLILVEFVDQVEHSNRDPNLIADSPLRKDVIYTPENSSNNIRGRLKKMPGSKMFIFTSTQGKTILLTPEDVVSGIRTEEKLEIKIAGLQVGTVVSFKNGLNHVDSDTILQVNPDGTFLLEHFNIVISPEEVVAKVLVGQEVEIKDKIGAIVKDKITRIDPDGMIHLEMFHRPIRENEILHTQEITIKETAETIANNNINALVDTLLDRSGFLKKGDKGNVIKALETQIDLSERETVDETITTMDMLMEHALDDIVTLLPGKKFSEGLQSNAIYDNLDSIARYFVNVDPKQLSFTNELLDRFADQVIPFFEDLQSKSLQAVGKGSFSMEVFDGLQSSGKDTVVKTINRINTNGAVNSLGLDQETQDFWKFLTDPNIDDKATGTRGISVPMNEADYKIYANTVSKPGSLLGNIAGTGAMVSSKFMHILVLFENIKSIISGKTGVVWNVYPRIKPQVELVDRLQKKMKQDNLELNRSSITFVMVTKEQLEEVKRDKYEASLASAMLGQFLRVIEGKEKSKGKSFTITDADMLDPESLIARINIYIDSDMEDFYRQYLINELATSEIVSEGIKMERYNHFRKMFLPGIIECIRRTQLRAAKEGREDDAQISTIVPRMRSHELSSLPGLIQTSLLVPAFGTPQESIEEYMLAKSKAFNPDMDTNSESFRKLVELAEKENYFTVYKEYPVEEAA